MSSYHSFLQGASFFSASQSLIQFFNNFIEYSSVILNARLRIILIIEDYFRINYYIRSILNYGIEVKLPDSYICCTYLLLVCSNSPSITPFWKFPIISKSLRNFALNSYYTLIIKLC